MKFNSNKYKVLPLDLTFFLIVVKTHNIKFSLFFFSLFSGQGNSLGRKAHLKKDPSSPGQCGSVGWSVVVYT